MSSFAPKQRLPLTPAAMQELMGDVTLQVARQFMKLISPLPTGSTVHDNACGNGIVTQAIIETQQPGTVIVHATDINPGLCQATAALAESKGWKDYVKTEVMPAEALIFEDNFFSHSFNNFHLFIVKETEKAAAHIYRTLQPGGTAIVTCWADVSHDSAILRAHEATRGPGAFHSFKSREIWGEASHLVSVLEEAGFKHVEMKSCDAILRIKNLEAWSKLAWSFLGAPMGPAGGWVEKDEERWDEAVGIVYDDLLDNEKVERDEAGGAEIRMVAMVAIVKK